MVAVQMIKESQDMNDKREKLNLPELAVTVEDLRDRASFLEVVQAAVQENGRLPAIQEISRAIKESRDEQNLLGGLLHPRVWKTKQMVPRHKRPHGRYMEPSVQMFLPGNRGQGQNLNAGNLSSPIEAAQLALYVSHPCQYS
jgi:hypothetical protein